MQQLHDGIGSGDGGAGVPANICDKRKRDNDISLSSKLTSKQSLVSLSIEKHGESIMFLAKTLASENEKNWQDAGKEQERIWQETRPNNIRTRINSLCDSKCAMVLRMTELSVMGNKDVVNAILHEVKGIEDEIKMNVEELNMLLATPKKSNRSPVGK